MLQAIRQWRAKWTSLGIQRLIIEHVGQWMARHYRVPDWQSITLGQAYRSLAGGYKDDVPLDQQTEV